MDEKNDGDPGRRQSNDGLPIDPRCHADFRALYEQEYHRLRGYLRHYMKDPFWAEDVAQDAFVAVALQWEAIRMPRPFLYAVARRLSTREKYRRAPALLDGQDVKDPADDPVGMVDDRVDVYAAIAALPERQREAVALFYIADLPLAEVSQIMRVTVAAVKSHLHLARAKLETALGPHLPRTRS